MQQGQDGTGGREGKWDRRGMLAFSALSLSLGQGNTPLRGTRRDTLEMKHWTRSGVVTGRGR